jgi:DHA2 family multidrug resistance protein
MAPNYSPTNPAFMSKLQAMKAAFITRGMAPNIAEASAYKALSGSMAKQAAVLSYMDIFLYLGIMFLIFVPVMFFVKQRKGAKVDKEALAGTH